MAPPKILPNVPVTVEVGTSEYPIKCGAASPKRKKSDDVSGGACKVARSATGHCCAGQHAIAPNYVNFLKSGLPRRIMCYSNGEWTDFPATVTSSLVEAFASKRSAVEVTVSGAHCLFDFVSMVLYNLKNGDRRSVAWIDKDERCFFPVFFVGGNGQSANESDGSNMEASSSDAVVGGCNERISDQPEMLKEAIAEEGVCVPPVKVATTKSLATEVVKLERDSKLFLLVMKSFLSGMGTFAGPENVISIRQFSPKAGASLNRLETFKKQALLMTDQHGNPNIQNGWLGTTKEGLSKILVHGFHKGARLSEGAAYGTGVYLAPEDRSFSCANLCDVDENGLQYMLLCRVVMGNMEQVPEGSKQTLPSRPEFDCGTDDLLNPKQYVIWQNRLISHVCLDCIVCFRLPSIAREYLSGLTDIGSANSIMSLRWQNAANDHPAVSRSEVKCTPISPWLSFTRLFDAIRNNIDPISKELLCIHHQEYLNHIISREELAQKMRVIVGDRLLISTVGRLQQNQQLPRRISNHELHGSAENAQSGVSLLSHCGLPSH